MAMRIYEQILLVLKNTPGKTQRGLAEHMGLNAATVNRMLHGHRKITAEEIPVIQNYLGVGLDLSGTASNDIEYRQDVSQHARHGGFSDVARDSGAFQARAPASRMQEDVVPVYGYAAGSLQKGLNLENGDVVDWAARHPAQAGISNAFAIYVVSDSMEPRYFAGELVYVHPGRPPEQGRDCVIEMNNGDAYIKRYLRQTDETIRVAQFNPPQEKDIPKVEVKAIYAVVGRG